MEGLNEEEKRALRGSKFAPLRPSSCPTSSRSHQPPRLAHPGGPMKTNKAAALAKFLERKLHDPEGLSSLNPNLVESAVQNAKRTMLASSNDGNSSRYVVRHVTSFSDSDQELPQAVKEIQIEKKKKKKKVKKRAKKNQIKVNNDGGTVTFSKPKKKLKL